MSEQNLGGSASILQDDYWWYRVRSGLLKTVFEPFAAGAESVLDVGSADGPSVGWLRGTRSHVTLDIDPRGLQAGMGVCGSALDLPFRDASFDVVGAFDVLEHCDPEDRALAEFARVLKPAGRMLISVPAYQWAWSDFDEENGHHRRYTARRARTAMEQAGLMPQRVTYAFAGTFPIFAAERVVRRMKQRFRRSGAQDVADVVSVPEVTPFQDRVLSALSRIDERVLAKRDLRFGSSVLVAATKPR